jgi:hypothetical protein
MEIKPAPLNDTRRSGFSACTAMALGRLHGYEIYIRIESIGETATDLRNKAGHSELPPKSSTGGIMNV